MKLRVINFKGRPLDALSDAALALFYPLKCVACGVSAVEHRADAPVCAACWAATDVFTGEETICWKCGTPSPAKLLPEQKPDVRCRRCDADHFTAARSVGVYKGALRASVLKLKHEPSVGVRLAELLARAQARSPLDTATLIIPVPLHAERERERGFNQAAQLARALSARARLPLDERSLVRINNADRHRAGMDARARRETVDEAFCVTRPRLVAGHRVLLIDDVLTTGATGSSCAHALRQGGAHEVFVLTVARAE